MSSILLQVGLVDFQMGKLIHFGNVATFSYKTYGPGHAKMPYANNKGADQPAHPRSLISTFVVRCLDTMICILAVSKVSRF